MIFDSLRQFHRSAEKGVPSKEFGAIGYVHPRSEEMRYPHLQHICLEIRIVWDSDRIICSLGGLSADTHCVKPAKTKLL